jgi:hypothetical protein
MSTLYLLEAEDLALHPLVRSICSDAFNLAINITLMLKCSRGVVGLEGSLHGTARSSLHFNISGLARGRHALGLIATLVVCRKILHRVTFG